MMEVSAVSTSRQISIQVFPQQRTSTPPRNETSSEENDFKMFYVDEVTDFSLFGEKLLSSNDVNFPILMDFMRINKIIPDIREFHRNIGYSIVHDINDINARWCLVRNLTYLYENGCDLNLELLNFLRSLTFGGKLIRHGDLPTNLKIIRTLLPFCTNFFQNDTYWNKIRYFCYDTEEVIAALKFLIVNYGAEKNCKFLQPPHVNSFSLKHLARNKVRDVIWSNKKCNVKYYKCCEINLPAVLFKYINFLE